MRKLTRLRSWIAFVVAASRNFLQQLRSAKQTAAQDSTDNAKGRGSGSAIEHESRPGTSAGGAPPVVSKPAAKPVAPATAVPKPAASSSESRPVAQNSGASATPKPPAVKVTVDAAPVNGSAQTATMNDQSAQRLARVLISEIKLYYMSKMEGQDESEMRNIYDLLKDPIDKSRQHYKQRVGAGSSLPDYFHGELVKTLCAGDESRLGPNYTQK